MEWLTGAGSWLLGIICGAVSGGLLAWLIVVVLKASLNRTISKLLIKLNFKDLQTQIVKETVKEVLAQIVKETVKEVLAQIKKLSYTQTIQPVVESELVKINERVDAKLAKVLAELIRKQDLTHKEIKALARYFDGSLGVTDEAKKELRLALAEYEKENPPKEQEITVVEEAVKEEVKEEEKTEKKAEKTEKNTIDVER